MGVQAKPLEPKPISEDEPAHVIHIDHAEEGVDDAANFAKVNQTKKYFRHFRNLEKRILWLEKEKRVSVNCWQTRLYIVSRMASLFPNWTFLTELPPSTSLTELPLQNIL